MSTRRIESLADSRPHAPGGRPLVWVVDADGAVRESVRALLGTIGAEVRGYARGHDLLDALHDGAAPACIIADLGLPDIGGLALLGELRARGVRVPTILLSTEADVSSAVSAMRAGALDFIEKPYIERALLNQVAPLLRYDEH
jgi:two-component system, LuxR family, response regulator FixJ